MILYRRRDLRRLVIGAAGVNANSSCNFVGMK
jgi:hypothetical protein